MTSPTIFHFIRMSKFPLLNGVTVVILVTFGEMCLDFSVCNISKNCTWYIDTWTDIYKISQSGFFSSPLYHLNDIWTPYYFSWFVYHIPTPIYRCCQDKPSTYHKYYNGIKIGFLNYIVSFFNSLL